MYFKGTGYEKLNLFEGQPWKLESLLKVHEKDEKGEKVESAESGRPKNWPKKWKAQTAGWDGTGPGRPETCRSNVVSLGASA